MTARASTTGIRQLAAVAGLCAAGVCHAAEPAAPLAYDKTTTASPGKPSAPIELSYVLRGEPAAGVPLTVELAVTSRVAADSLRMEIGTADDDLALVSITGAELVAALDAGAQQQRRVVVLPREEGQYYLNVVATLLRDGESQARAFSVPLRIGEGGFATRPRAEVKMSDSGRPLISLPAVESAAQK